MEAVIGFIILQARVHVLWFKFNLCFFSKPVQFFYTSYFINPDYFFKNWFFYQLSEKGLQRIFFKNSFLVRLHFSSCLLIYLPLPHTPYITLTSPPIHLTTCSPPPTPCDTLYNWRICSLFLNCTYQDLNRQPQISGTLSTTLATHANSPIFVHYVLTFQFPDFSLRKIQFFHRTQPLFTISTERLSCSQIKMGIFILNWSRKIELVWKKNWLKKK